MTTVNVLTYQSLATAGKALNLNCDEPDPDCSIKPIREAQLAEVVRQAPDTQAAYAPSRHQAP
jgi:hypothetical protein